LTLVLYQHPFASFARKALVALYELDQADRAYGALALYRAGRDVRAYLAGSTDPDG
jgi:hypothetical protein